MFIFWILMDIPEYTFKEVGYSGSLQDIANILEYPQEQVLFSGLLLVCTTSATFYEAGIITFKSVTSVSLDVCIVCLNLVSCFIICPPTIRNNSSKSVGVRRVKFVKPVESFSINLSNSPTAYLGPSSNKLRHHKHLRFLFLPFLSTIMTKHALTPHRAMSYNDCL